MESLTIAQAIRPNTISAKPACHEYMLQPVLLHKQVLGMQCMYRNECTLIGEGKQLESMGIAQGGMPQGP